MAPHSSIDPSTYAVLGLTHVQYDGQDPLARLLALVTLSPIFLLCSYVTIILYRRELTFINALIGQLGCEAVNWGLKRLFRQSRPTDHLGSGYGMPSSHSQFVGFFAAYFLAHFYLHHPKKSRPATLINTMRRLEHAFAMACIAGVAALTAYSRYHLSYHTPAQIWVGLTLGLAIGIVWYYLVEYIPRQPLRLPAPLGSPLVSSPPTFFDKTPGTPDNKLRRRNGGAASESKSPASDSSLPHRRRSSLSSLLPELHPAPPLRQIMLDHPLAVAFRVRDSWTVWSDGGIEQEYGRWRSEWERRRRDDVDSAVDLVDAPSVRMPSLNAASPFAPSSSAKRSTRSSAKWVDVQSERHYAYLLKTLALADKCVPNQTAFCVGCVISPSTATSSNDEADVLATGYSRELPGNTHAEECALAKLTSASLRQTELDLYTSMEPCSVRASGNAPCVQRILQWNEEAAEHGGARICRVFMGVKEPEDFVLCKGVEELRAAGVEVYTVTPPSGAKGTRELKHGWLEREALRLAKKSHEDEKPSEGVEKLWRGKA